MSIMGLVKYIHTLERTSLNSFTHVSASWVFDLEKCWYLSGGFVSRDMSCWVILYWLLSVQCRAALSLFIWVQTGKFKLWNAGSLILYIMYKLYCINYCRVALSLLIWVQTGKCKLLQLGKLGSLKIVNLKLKLKISPSLFTSAYTF